jgi:hypothetical protein
VSAARARAEKYKMVRACWGHPVGTEFLLHLEDHGRVLIITPVENWRFPISIPLKSTEGVYKHSGRLDQAYFIKVG